MDARHRRLAWLAICMAVVLGLASAIALVGRVVFAGPAPARLERFYDGNGYDGAVAGAPSANQILRVSGSAIVDPSCQAMAADGKVYAMHGMPYLVKHPTRTDMCVFIRDDQQPSVMDGSLSACDSADFLGGSDVVADVAPMDVAGVRKCVVTLNNGLDRSSYEAYERGARERTLKRTQDYTDLDAQRRTITDRLAAVEAEIEQRTRTAAAMQQQIVDLNGTKADLTNRRDALKTQYDQIVIEVDVLRTQVSKQTTKADRLEQFAQQLQARFDALLKERSAAEQRLQETTNSVAANTNLLATLHDQGASVDQKISNQIQTLQSIREETQRIQ